MIFQNLTAKGGNGGDGISGGGGGMGAGGAIYAPQSFLNGSYPSITLLNVSINSCSAVGGNGGSYSVLLTTGNEGGGGGGGVNQSGTTPAEGGNSLGGGGGGGSGPSSGFNAAGGSDIGNLGGGSGGSGANTVGSGFGGGEGGGGSGVGGAIFIDSNLNLTIQAFSGIPTTFNTSNNTTQAGTHGTDSTGSSDGLDGSALGNSIFLRSGSSLTLLAQDVGDLLTLGEQVAFTDDTVFGAGGTNVFVGGNGTVIYNGTTAYQGYIMINNANFKVNGEIDGASIAVCRNIGFSTQRGILSGNGILTGDIFVNSGIISPDIGGTLTLGSLSLSPADLMNDTLGSLVHIAINSSSIPSTVAVNGPASLAGTFDLVTFTGTTPNYSLTYNPTFVQLNFLGYSSLEPASNLQGKQKKNDFGLVYELYNQLTWAPSPSPNVTGYFIYRDGEKIAAVNASTYTYQDHNRKRGVSYAYAIAAFNSSGSESSPISIVIKGIK